MPGKIMTEQELARNSGQQSLLMAMNKFVQAVNDMDETIMIPSKLRDIPVEEDISRKDIPKGKNGSAVVPVNGTNGTVAVAKQPQDLFSFYTMLNAIKMELVRGPLSEEELEEEEAAHHIDEQSKQTAAVFRHHLKGLFSLLKQLTDTAQNLSTKYQEELGGEYSSSSTLSHFAM